MKKLIPYCQFFLSAFSFLVIAFFIFGYLYFEFSKNGNFLFFSELPTNIVYLSVALAVISNLPFLKGIISEIVKDKVETETLDKVKKYCFSRFVEKPEIIIEMNRLLDEYNKSKSKITNQNQIDNLSIKGETK
jgi:hypothetical protein